MSTPATNANANASATAAATATATPSVAADAKTAAAAAAAGGGGAASSEHKLTPKSASPWADRPLTSADRAAVAGSWKMERYGDAVQHWPRAGQHILAQYDDQTVVVYQAYCDEIGQFAAANHHFTGCKQFSLSRMTWIKVSACPCVSAGFARPSRP
jgi:hypothetical protein